MACVSILSIPVSPLNMQDHFCDRAAGNLNVMYLKSGKVKKNQRQGLDIADSVDWDLKPHLNMCALY